MEKEKKTVTMSNWKLRVDEGGFYLSGTTDQHPVYGKNAYISRTSALERYSFEEDVLTYETRNTIYVCPLKYMKTNSDAENLSASEKKKLMELVKRDETLDGILDKIAAASASMSLGIEPGNEFTAHILEIAAAGKAELEAIKKADEERMINIAKEYDDCVYIEVSGAEAGDKLAYHIGEECGIVEPNLHSGMFQDSILYLKFEQDGGDVTLDFRYFPKGMFGEWMETYSWPENIKQVVIKNIWHITISFNNQNIAPGETEVMTREDSLKRQKEGFYPNQATVAFADFDPFEGFSGNESFADFGGNKSFADFGGNKSFADFIDNEPFADSTSDPLTGDPAEEDET